MFQACLRQEIGQMELLSASRKHEGFRVPGSLSLDRLNFRRVYRVPVSVEYWTPHLGKMFPGRAHQDCQEFELQAEDHLIASQVLGLPRTIGGHSVFRPDQHKNCRYYS